MTIALAAIVVALRIKMVTMNKAFEKIKKPNEHLTLT
jgi:hypothetical protein